MKWLDFFKLRNKKCEQPRITDNARETSSDQQNSHMMEFELPKDKKVMAYGMTRTVVDIIKCLNTRNHYKSPEVLINDIRRTLEDYGRRGTLMYGLLECICKRIQDNWSSLFINGVLDVEKLSDCMEDFTKGNDEIGLIFSTHVKTKILRVVIKANRFRHYTNPQDLASDLTDFYGGREIDWAFLILITGFYHTHVILGLRYFLDNIPKMWKYVTIDYEGRKVLDNDKLEDYVFTEHESRVLQLGLDKVLENDYEESPGCHSIAFFPKKVNSGPIYEKDGLNSTPIKACYPSDDALIQQRQYEAGFWNILFRKLIKSKEYVCKYDKDNRRCYYIPSVDYSRPIMEVRDCVYEEVKFMDSKEKLSFIANSQKLADWLPYDEDR